jgi:prepilin-type N-terminal cleavage/methylation domain-containing protein
MSPPGRPKGELVSLWGTARSAQGAHIRAPGGPKGEYRSAQHEGRPVSRGNVRAVHGFTLLEMLVTLVLAAMVTAIFSQGLAQIVRIEALLAGARLSGQAEVVRVEWLRRLLAGTVPRAAGFSDRLRGTATEVAGLTTDPVDAQHLGVATYQVRLVFSADDGVTELRIRTGTSDVEKVLFRWPGRTGRILYQDRAGAWRDEWPPPFGGGAAIDGPSRLGPARPLLPLAVAIETGLAGTPVILASLWAGPASLTPLADDF